MKAKEAPEKIYTDENGNNPLLKRHCDSDIEYTRTDVFIKKAVSYLDSKLYDWVQTTNPNQRSYANTIMKQDFIDGFINYIKENKVMTQEEKELFTTKKEITMAIIKSYTDLEQSKKLSEILPLESADNVIVSIGDREGVKTITMPKETLNILRTPFTDIRNTIPCWSLAALLEQFPYELCDDDGNSLYLEINKEADVYQLVYTDCYEDFESIETDRYEHFVDACVDMIIKLNGLKMI